MRSVKPAMLASILFGLSSHAIAAPCDGIDRSLSDHDKAVFAQAIAQQHHSKKVDILDYFGSGSWRIIYADTYDADEGFFFYSKSPPTEHYITVWSGVATYDETSDIEQWTVENANGIPKALAACFAWSVTNGPR